MDSAFDDRFKFDKRFFNDEDEVGDQIDNKDEFETEKKQNLNILNRMFGSSSHKTKSPIKKNELIIPRYDPNCDNANKKIKGSNKNNRKGQSNINKEDKNEENLVSEERYYEVNKSLKSIFNSDNFTFGDEQQKTNQQNIEENFEKKEEINTKSNYKRENQMNSFKGPQVKLKQQRFFFSQNDHRFSEDIFYDTNAIEQSKANWRQRQEEIKKSMRIRKTIVKNRKEKNLNHKNFNHRNFSQRGRRYAKK